jgi:hypothetical protein
MLLVAGMSGVGKSTFIQQLVSASVPSSITNLLPADCATWTEVLAIDAPTTLADMPAADVKTIIFHYALNNLHHSGASDFAGDPLLFPVAHAERIIALTVKSDADRLWLQFSRRSFGGSNSDETCDAVRRARKLNESFEAGKKHTNPRVVESRERSRNWLNTLARYEQTDWIDSQFERWNDFLASLAAEGRLVRNISIAPVSDIYGAHAPDWNLLDLSVGERLPSSLSTS